MHPPVTCLVPSESPRQGGVYGLCFVAFQPTVLKILNFNVFMSKKIRKFYFSFDCGNSIVHTSIYTTKIKLKDKKN